MLIFLCLLSHILVLRAVQFDHSMRNDFVCTDRIEMSLRTSHEIVIAMKQLNTDTLERIVYEVSDPLSVEYGRYLSREEVGELTKNRVALDIVKDFLAMNNILHYEETLYGEYVTARASLLQWEQLFSAKFRPYQHIASGEIFTRSSSYVLHSSLVGHVVAIYNLADLPLLDRRRGSVLSSFKSSQNIGYIIPAALNSFYNVFTNQGNSLTSQTVY